MSKLYLIGIGYKPLEERASEVLLNAEYILASDRLFDIFERYREFSEVRRRIRVINDVNESLEFVKEQFRAITGEVEGGREGIIVLLASGDPMFFGIGRRAIEEFGSSRVVIFPDLSCIQLAFSRIGEPWDDAFLISLHGGPGPGKRRKLPYGLKDIPSLLESHTKIAVLTDKENNPTEIANVIAGSISPILSEDEAGAPSVRNDIIRMFVCERLGYPGERITGGMPGEIVGMTFDEPNVVILIRESGSYPSPPCSRAEG